MENKLTEMFEEFLLMYKVINRKNIIDILRTELNSEQLIEIYQLTDGERSTRDISSILRNKCSHVTVYNTWNKWALIGIVSPASKKGRYKAAFNLFEYGISQPENNEKE